MDVAGRPAARGPLIRAALLILFFASVSLLAYGAASDLPLATVKQWFAEGEWQKIVTAVQVEPAPSPDVLFYYGTALARLERWDDAAAAFRTAAKLLPKDKRFPEQLAGVAFKQKEYSRAIHHLHRALQLSPNDDYADNFLATIYFLQGNLEAALQYWNRVGKPELHQVFEDPVPHIDPALLDRTFAFAPATELLLPQLLTTKERVGALGIFPRYSFDLQARDDGTFDLAFRNWERDAWGGSTLASLFLIFRGLPFQTIYPSYFNFHHQAINFTSLLRWDAQKRRITADISVPVQSTPKWHYDLGVDLRNENWDVLTSFTGPATLLGGLNLRREALSATFSSIESGRWDWSVAGEFSHRDYRSVVPGTALTSTLLTPGYEFKAVGLLNTDLWRIPEHRFDLRGGSSVQVGRLWATSYSPFEKLQGSLRMDWFPLLQGDDYHVSEQVRAGRTFGDIPFDELFMLGLERDNDLWMRAHIGTRDGRKGSAPLGRNYFLSNWGIDKSIYDRGLFQVKLGPFVDTGKITDPIDPALGSRKWLWDTGVEAKLNFLGTQVVLTYGKDLRSGNNAIYLTLRDK